MSIGCNAAFGRGVKTLILWHMSHRKRWIIASLRMKSHRYPCGIAGSFLRLLECLKSGWVSEVTWWPSVSRKWKVANDRLFRDNGWRRTTLGAPHLLNLPVLYIDRVMLTWNMVTARRRTILSTWNRTSKRHSCIFRNGYLVFFCFGNRMLLTRFTLNKPNRFWKPGWQIFTDAELNQIQEAFNRIWGSNPRVYWIHTFVSHVPYQLSYKSCRAVFGHFT